MRKLNSNHEALFYTRLAHKRVQCGLCPRRCAIEDGKTGYCGVRKNKAGILHAISYGKVAYISEEVIETEAVFHFEPGARILSLGNVGCNLDCVYCQNWRFSQIQHADKNTIFDYTPEQIVKIALERNIKMLSWTYNDPAVWIEFVIDTAGLARKHGLYNLFKSAMFLTPEATEALMKVIDIFSISIKSTNPDYYPRYTRGWVGPVLDATKQIFDSRRQHLEISNLVVTGASDTEKDFNNIIAWFKASLSSEVPLHFVRFHPAYKYTQAERTPVSSVEKARQLAIAAGLEYSYLGNVFMHDGLNTYCKYCNNLLIERIGLNTARVGIEPNCKTYICKYCKAPTGIRMACQRIEVYENCNL